MAGRKRKVNKSEAIRKELEANPSAKPQEIVEALKKKRIAVTPAYVSTIKFNHLSETKTMGPGQSNRGRRSSNQQVPIDALRLARAFARKLGGVRAAREALDAWESIAAG